MHTCICYDLHMKRTTINLPDDLYALLEAERKRRDVSVTAVVREALEKYLTGTPAPRRLRIAALGKSDGTRALAADVEDILAEEWGSEEGQNRLMYGTPDRPGAGARSEDVVPTSRPESSDTPASG